MYSGKYIYYGLRLAGSLGNFPVFFGIGDLFYSLRLALRFENSGLLGSLGFGDLSLLESFSFQDRPVCPRCKSLVRGSKPQ